MTTRFIRRLSSLPSTRSMAPERVVIVGSGWAGFKLAQGLNDKKFDITVISPADTVPYTPLLASAACGLFDFSLAEEPIRRKSRKINFYKSLVQNVDFKTKTCKCIAHCQADDGEEKEFEVPYDRLILTPGCVPNTFDTPGVAENAFFVRDVEDAKKLQYRVKQLLELASIPGTSEQQVKDLLHVIVVGGGPTGVEIAAELSDLFNHDFAELYPHLKGKMSIAIHDAAPGILGPFDGALQDHAIASFNRRNVEIVTKCKIKNVEKESMTTEAEGKIGCGMVIWTAGNKQCPLVDTLKEEVSVSDKLPRILTNGHLHVLDNKKQPMPDVYALGDAADIDEKSLPTTAQVATQKATYLVNVLNKDIDGKKEFDYNQKPLVAYIGGGDGVISGKSDYTGQQAWAAWRGGNLMWTESWKKAILISTYWGLNLFTGKEVARK